MACPEADLGGQRRARRVRAPQAVGLGCHDREPVLATLPLLEALEEREGGGPPCDWPRDRRLVAGQGRRVAGHADNTTLTPVPLMVKHPRDDPPRLQRRESMSMRPHRPKARHRPVAIPCSRPGLLAAPPVPRSTLLRAASGVRSRPRSPAFPPGHGACQSVPGSFPPVDNHARTPQFQEILTGRIRGVTRHDAMAHVSRKAPGRSQEGRQTEEKDMAAEPHTTSPSLAEAAIAYAARGLRVFPLHGIVADSRTKELRCTCAKGSSCARPGKHPLGRLARHGSTDATENSIVVAEWWQKAPYANVGIATGTPVGREGSHLGVVDIDPDHGGNHTLRALVGSTPEANDEWRAMRGAPAVRTGSGGAHFYVVSDQRSNFAGAVGTDRAGVDFRGSGGYVVAPPSRHISGHHYRWVTPLDMAELPSLPSPLDAWLSLPINSAPSAGDARTRSYVQEVADPVLRRRLGAYRDAVVADVTSLIATAPNGRQHAALFSGSCRLFDLARAGLIAHADARALLMAEGARMRSFDAKRPWTEGEIARHVDNAWVFVSKRGTTNVPLPAELAGALGLVSPGTDATQSVPSPTAGDPVATSPAVEEATASIQAGSVGPDEPAVADAQPGSDTPPNQLSGDGGATRDRPSTMSLFRRLTGDTALYDQAVARLVAAASQLAAEGSRQPYRETLAMLRAADPHLFCAMGLAAARHDGAPSSAAARCLAKAMATSAPQPGKSTGQGSTAQEEIAALVASTVSSPRGQPTEASRLARDATATPRAAHRPAFDVDHANDLLDRLGHCARVIAGQDPSGAQRVVERLSVEHPRLLDALGHATASLIGPIEIDVTNRRIVEVVLARRQFARKSARTSADTIWCEAVSLGGETPRPTAFPDARTHVAEQGPDAPVPAHRATIGVAPLRRADVDVLAYHAVFGDARDAQRATEAIAEIETKRAAAVARRFATGRRGADLAADLAASSTAALARWDPTRGVPYGAYSATVMAKEARRAMARDPRSHEPPVVSLDALPVRPQVAAQVTEPALPPMAELTEGLPSRARALLASIHEGDKSVATAAAELGIDAATARQTLKFAYAELARRPAIRRAAKDAGLDPEGRDIAPRFRRSPVASPSPAPAMTYPPGALPSHGAAGYFGYLAR